MTHEDITLWAVASLTKHFKEYAFGVPVVFGQQQPEPNRTRDQIHLLINGPDFKSPHSHYEINATVLVTLIVYTSPMPTDVYYHTRMRAKAVQACATDVRLLKIGSPGLPGTLVGYLRPVQTENIALAGDQTMVQQFYVLNIC